MSHSHFGYVFHPTSATLEGARPDGKMELRKIGELKVAGGDWIEYELEYDKLITSYESNSKAFLPPPFFYRVIARQRAELMIVAAESRGIIDVLLQSLWGNRGFRKAEINVHALVIAIIESTLKLNDGTGAKLTPCISFLNAETTGYGPSMDWVTFQGSDLSIAKMVVDSKDRVKFRRCGLRIPIETYERARVAVNGALDFHQNSLSSGSTREAGTQIEELLLDLKRARFIRDEGELLQRSR